VQPGVIFYPFANKTGYNTVIVSRRRREAVTDGELRKKFDLIRRKDVKAFEEVYSDMKTPVFTVILRITRSRELSEDIFQELFVRLFTSPPGETVKKPRAYILQMAHNLAIDAVKGQPRLADIADFENLSAREADEDAYDARQALAALPLKERRIVALHINGGLKFREIAGITGEPLGTVLWRYRKALDSLRKMLEGGSYEKK